MVLGKIQVFDPGCQYGDRLKVTGVDYCFISPAKYNGPKNYWKIMVRHIFEEKCGGSNFVSETFFTTWWECPKIKCCYFSFFVGKDDSFWWPKMECKGLRFQVRLAVLCLYHSNNLSTEAQTKSYVIMKQIFTKLLSLIISCHFFCGLNGLSLPLGLLF